MAQLITTLGPKRAEDLGPILPHEHVFVDLRTWDKPGYGEGEAADVIRLMAPEIERIKAQGFTALVECSTIGVGRRADIDRAVSEATDFPIVVPTGIYREPWVPPFGHEWSEDALAEWMIAELEEGIEDSGVQAAWIKISAGDDGITDTEAKILRAAARAGARTNAVIGSHTIRGRVVMEQLNILEDAGYTASRFIWIHTQAEPDFALHLEAARRGAWVENDGIGGWGDPNLYTDAYNLDMIRNVLDAGFGDQLLISHDRGWYDPAEPGGGTPKPYTYLVDTFLPKLEASGVDRTTIDTLIRDNPFRAFAR
ncbi:phosphotriesterase family protein [Bauldia sp.]|uniref:phosphotriesterase family protein n=1 Tax=Bauldia sp. TaxID=2575872 RepID=UPI003BAB4894